MPSASIRSHTRPGSTRRRHTWVAPYAVTPHVKHQPLQWNIGRVHRYRESNESPVSSVSPMAFR